MKHTVLLVEDEIDLREMMQEALELSGFAVIAVGDGQEALDALADIDSLCLVLLDLVMPRMNGWEFFEQLRALPRFAGVPVVIHSSDPSRAPSGAERVMKKPVRLEQLVSVLQEYCTVRQ